MPTTVGATIGHRGGSGYGAYVTDVDGDYGPPPDLDFLLSEGLDHLRVLTTSLTVWHVRWQPASPGYRRVGARDGVRPRAPSIATSHFVACLRVTIERRIDGETVLRAWPDDGRGLGAMGVMSSPIVEIRDGRGNLLWRRDVRV